VDTIVSRSEGVLEREKNSVCFILPSAIANARDSQLIGLLALLYFAVFCSEYPRIFYFGPPDFNLFAIKAEHGFALNRTRLLFNGCEISHDTGAWDGRGVLNFSKPVKANQFILEGYEAEPHHLPSFSIIGSADDWATNQTVVSTDSRLTIADPVLDVDPETGQTRISLTRRPPWPWMLSHPIHHLTLALAFISLSACGAIGRASAATETAIIFSFLLSLLNAASAIGYAALNRVPHSLPPVLSCAAYLLFAAALPCAPQRSALACLLLGVAWILASLACSLLLPPRHGALWPPALLPAAAMATLGASFLLRRRRRRRRAAAAAAADAGRFAEAWRRLAGQG
jgi:hypothetical protein